MWRWLKNLFEKKLPAKFVHDELGLLIRDSSLWNGSVQKGGRDIAFSIAGTEAAPSPVLVERAVKLLSNLPDLQTAALQFLCQPGLPIKPRDFTLQSLDLLLPTRADYFVLAFSLDGDPDAIWRVEFQDNQPKYTGRDD